MPNFSLDDEVFFRAAEKFPTPFHLYDEQGIRLRARRLKAAFAWCKDFREYFAVKALPNPAVLRIMKEEGCGLDCSSATELMLAKACGFSGEEIILSANAMPPEEFTQARALGAFINLDDLTDVELLRTHGGFPSCVCLRYNPGGQFSIGNTIMGNPGEAKYGMTLPQLKEALTILKREGVTAFGLHAFLASNTIDPAYYPGLAEVLMTLGRDLAAELGIRFAFVDLSGGISIPYKLDIRVVLSLIEIIHHGCELVKCLGIEFCDHITYMEAYAVDNVVEYSEVDIVLREFIFMVCVYEDKVSSVYIRSVMNFCCIL